ncbi:MAG: hypothetical protein AB1611_14290 [bacterium]
MVDSRELSHSEHIARYCKPTSLTEDKLPTWSSFCLRSGELSLSVNWLEFLDPNNRDTAIEKLRQIFTKKFTGGVSANAKLAVLNVGETITHVSNENGRLLKVFQEPLDNDPSHCGIHNLPATEEEAMLIGMLIAEKVCELYSARS